LVAWLFARLTRSASATIGSTNFVTSPPSDANLADQRRGDERATLRRQQEHVLDRRFEFGIHFGHLKLVLEVGHRAQSAQDEARAHGVRIVDQQSVEALDLHAFSKRGENPLAQADAVEQFAPIRPFGPTYRSQG
jgi:hypothetical protein